MNAVFAIAAGAGRSLVLRDASDDLANCGLPVFRLDQLDEIATFVVEHAVSLPRGIDAPDGSE